MAEKLKYADEVALVNAAYKRKKSAEGLTQESLAHAMGVTQGLIGHWMNGRTRIPDQTLMELGLILGFNPVEVRPDIQKYYDLIAKHLASSESKEVDALMRGLSEGEAEQAVTYIRFLVGQRR